MGFIYLQTQGKVKRTNICWEYHCSPCLGWVPLQLFTHSFLFPPKENYLHFTDTANSGSEKRCLTPKITQEVLQLGATELRQSPRMDHRFS
jgi:hypothetical protein